MSTAVAPSRMGARRSRRSSDIVRQSPNSTITPRRPLQLEQPPAKPAQSGGKDRAGRRISSKQYLVHGEDDAGDGDRGIVVVGEKAMALTRAEAGGAGRDPARIESVGSVAEEESSRQAEKDEELSGLAALFQAEIERAAEAQIVEHLKQRTAQALKEAAVLRHELERTEAAVVEGKKKRDSDVAERESQLQRCQEEIRRLESEVEYHRVQLAQSDAEGVRLGEELRRTQESLQFLSAWDEEKIELESEVASLKAQLSAAAKEGIKQLDLAHQEFNITSAVAGQKARLRLERDTEKMRLDLERGLTEEFKSLRRENEVLRRETAHKDSEINRIMKNAALIESDKRAARAELADERRMHHTTMRKKKQAEGIITELQAQLSLAFSSAPGRPFSPPNINPSPRRPKNQWGSPRPPAPGRGKLLIRQSHDKGGGYGELLPGSGRRGPSKVSMLLVPARKSGDEDCDGDGDQENAGADGFVGAPPAESSAATATAARRDPDIPPERGRGRERPGNKGRAHVVGGEKHGGDDIPELLACRSGSEVTAGDVWGVLDSYVHRRSEVAHAKRHLGAIEAMRRHLEKINKRAQKGSSCSATTVQYDYRGRRRVRVGGQNHERNSDEAVWRASRGKRARQDDRLGEAHAMERRAPSDWGRPAQRKNTLGTRQTKPRVRLQPHPPPRCKRDGSVSSMSQVTWSTALVKCDQDSTAGKARSPWRRSPDVASTGSRDEDAAGRATARGRAEKENAGRGGTMTMLSDGGPYRPRDTGSNSDHPRVRRRGSLTCPSSGDGDPPSCISGDTASVHRPPSEEEGSAAMSVVVRSPSPASSLASGVGVKAAAGRLWGDNATEGVVVPSEHQGGGGIGGLGLKGRAGGKKGGKLGTWGKRTERRDTELTDWLETNTNLVNVCPW